MILSPIPVGTLCSIVYELQEERGKPSLVEPKSNNQDCGSDLFDVCIRFPFEASSYDRIVQVAVEHASPLIRL